MKTIRIFISSPGDVAEERDKAEAVIRDLDRYYSGRARLVVVRWENLGLGAQASFQEGIVQVLTAGSGVDIAVFIMWARLGTPQGAWALRPDGQPYRSGTEQEFDLMLQASHESEGSSPHLLAYVRDDDRAFQVLLAAAPPAEQSNLVEQRQLAQQFIAATFTDAATGQNLRAFHTYDQPVSFADRLRVHLRDVLDQMTGDIPGAVRWDHRPYRGLEAFDVAHEAIFRGREEQVCEVLHRLRQNARDGCAFAVLVGASGSGKSSLARAGIVPSLLQHAHDGAKQWRHAVFTPSLAASAPLAGLVEALAAAGALPELRAQVPDLAALAQGLAADPAAVLQSAFLPAWRAACAAAGGPVRLIVVVDQMEELFASPQIGAEERAAFLRVLATLACHAEADDEPPFRILATLRSDFYAAAQQEVAFLQLKGRHGHFDLLPPDPAALHRIIVEPAWLAGLEFEERDGVTLDRRLLTEAVRGADALPLLEYALDALFEQRETSGPRPRLTHAAYEAMGGVEGALGGQAEKIFLSLPEEVRAAFGAVMQELVTVDASPEAPPLRQRAPLARLTDTPAKKALVTALLEARFFTADADTRSGAPVASLAHEALLRRWERLATWIEANRESLRARARVEQAQALWEGDHPEPGRRDPSLLLPEGLPLEEARGLLRTALPRAGTAEYIRASIARHEAVAARGRRLRRNVLTALSLLLLAALAAAFVAVKSQRRGESLLWEASKSDSEESLRKLAIEADWNTAVAYGTRALRIRPGNAAAAGELFRHTILAGMAPSRILPHDGPVTRAQFLPDRAALLTVSRDYKVLRWDPAGGNRWNSGEIFAAGPGEKIAALSPGGDRIGLLLPDGSVRVTDLATRAAGPTLNAAAASAVFSPHGDRLLTLSAAGALSIWDAQSGGKLPAPSLEGDAMTAAALAPDGARLLAETKKGAIRCWKSARSKNVEGWEVEWTLEDALAEGAAELAISPEGSRFAAATKDHTGACWSLSTHFKVASLPAEQAVSCVAYSADGLLVATGGKGGSVQLWERVSGQALGFLRGHRGRITALSFASDGRFLVSASQDGTARLWELARCPLDVPEANADAADTPPAPRWVYDSLLPFLCGKELDREGKISDLSVDRQLQAQAVVDQRLAILEKEPGAAAGPWDRFLAWKFLADARTRTLSPASTVSLPAFVEKTLWKGDKLADESARRVAWRAAPGHPLVQWSIAKAHSGGVWGQWLRERALRQMKEPANRTLYGEATVARWATAQAADAAAEHQPAGEFTNSLGMKFLPVTVGGGQSVLFSVWETRVQDYAAFASERIGVNELWKDLDYKGQKVSPTPDSPVGAMTWQEARDFCQWLTEHERALGKITASQRYRLPTDEEWSWAVGIGEEEDEALRGRVPKDKDSKVGAYPWGTLKFPPRDDQGKPLGNYCDGDCRKAFPDMITIGGFFDGFATTAPVGTYPANAHGLYDLAGNQWEWCEDWYDRTEKVSRVVRGGSWRLSGSVALLASFRRRDAPDTRPNDVGFRCVLAEDAPAATSP